ncbi:MAG: peptidoglycan DD-metalloendopeptidase family protein [Candidatus Krumholzibacteriia bacterium]
MTALATVVAAVPVTVPVIAGLAASAGSAVAAAAAAAPAGRADSAVYQVRRGDYLGLIASRFGVSVGDLRVENRLASDVIHPGQRLKIRSPFRHGRDGDVRWARPVSRPGRILREFGPYEQDGVVMPRTGVDVAATVGTEVRSAAHGVVRYVGEVDGFGRLVIVEHGAGYSTVLSPLQADSLPWSAGDAVLQGDLLGCVAEPQEGDEPYLHIELRRRDRAVSPAPLLR